MTFTWSLHGAESLPIKKNLKTKVSQFLRGLTVFGLLVVRPHWMIITPRMYGQMRPAASHREQRLLPLIQSHPTKEKPFCSSSGRRRSFTQATPKANGYPPCHSCCLNALQPLLLIYYIYIKPAKSINDVIAVYLAVTWPIRRRFIQINLSN